MRVKVLAFRDFYVDGPAALSESPFFSLPDQNELFRSFIEAIRASGGGDEPESGLEALALALKSDWTREGDRQRHVIVVWTDASAHKLPGDIGKRQEELPRDYPDGLSLSLDDLTELWHSQEISGKRLAATIGAAR